MASRVGPLGPATRNQEVITTDGGVELSPLKSRRRADAGTPRGESDASLPAAQGGAAPRVVSELERLLRTPGCPACGYVDEAERSFFSWLQIESHTVAEVQARLRASMGMCPVHSRRLVEGVGGGHMMTILLREALAGARRRLRDEGEPGPCPACEAVAFGAQRARQMVLDGLNNPAQARLYFEHGGICLPHFLDAVPSIERSAIKPLAERLLRTLADIDAEDSGLVALLGGADHDAPRRAHWRERLGEPPRTGSALEQICARFGIEACPVCLSTGLAERGYVRWYLEHAAQNDPSLRNDPGELCAAHLHDVALADAALAAQAVEHKRAARMARLTRLLARLGEIPEPARRGRGAADGELDAARQELLTAPYCPACNARDGIERSQLDLVVAAVALSSARERYERGHGLCVHHSMQVPDGQAARLARRHVDARLGILAWEVGETARKYAWAYRHERGDHEQSAWLRSLAQIDGRVFEGGPAPAEVAATEAEPA